jgi:capsular exopolysaccharide synthesis family protein
VDNNFDINQEENIDIRKYVFKFLANWYLFVLSIFIALSISFYINKFTLPTYSIGLDLLLKSDDPYGSRFGSGNLMGFGMFDDQTNINNEIGILQSFSLNKKVIDELDFEISYYSVGRMKTQEKYRSSPFSVNIDTSKNQLRGFPFYVEILSRTEYRLEINEEVEYFDTLLVNNNIYKFGEQVDDFFFNFNITLNEPSSFDFKRPNYGYSEWFFIINSINGLINSYRAKINIELQDKEGSILNLITEGQVAEKEANYLNKLAEVYIRSGLDDKNRKANKTIEFINNQLGEIVDSLTQAERNLENFRLNNKIIDLSRQGIAISEKYEELIKEEAQQIIQAEYYNYLLEYVENKNDYSDLVAPSIVGIQEPQISSIIIKLSELLDQRNTLLFSANESIPTLNLIDLNISNAKKSLLENIRNIKKTFEISQESLSKRISKVNSEIAQLPKTESELINIQREFDLNNEIYTYLLEKKAESGIALASNVPDSKILDNALLFNATIVSPKKKMNFLIALVIGLLIPVLLIIGRDYFNDKIVDHKDIEGKVKIPIIGTVGKNVREVEIPVFDKPKSSLAESFRSLRTNLEYLLSEAEKKVIILTSTVSGEGKTFCAINLASIIAMSDKKVLLIGMDLRKPKIQKAFAMLKNDIGMSTYLIKKSNIDEIIQTTNIRNLSVIPSGPTPPNPAELAGTQRMEDLISYAKKEYDYVIIDTPPVALVTDALILSRFSDLNIFVIRQNYSKKSVLSLIEELDSNQNMKNLGILVNDVMVPSYYGYGYGGYGYGGYGYGGYGYGGYGYGGYGYGYYDEDYEPLSLWEKILVFLKLKSRKKPS